MLGDTADSGTELGPGIGPGKGAGIELQPVALADKSLNAYAPFVDNEVIAEITTLARGLRGARVLHVSATASGGGVAEMLYTLVPLMRSVGLRAEWRVITGSEAFFTVTKRLHNALQGEDLDLTAAMQSTYLGFNQQNAASLAESFDFVVVHDPQPAALRCFVPQGMGAGAWIWRCHIDLTTAQPTAWQFLRPYIETYDAAIFTLPDFVQPDLRVGAIAIIPPAIDPLSPKNAFLSTDQFAAIVARAGVDPQRPTLLQVSRYDPWKDPLGVIDVFRRVRLEAPRVQLVMLGAPAHDDPEGKTILEQTRAYADGDPDIHLLTNAGGSREVNAFQRQAAIVLQKSLREGFGLTVAEALWKARPVVASNVGGIPLQIEDGVSGFLVTSTDQCVDRVLEALREPEEAARLGRNGHDRVRQRFLSTAHLRNYLQLLNQLA